MMSWQVDATLTGSMGVALLLLAFLLNLAKVLRSDEWPYLGLNVVGAGLACYSSYLIQFMPFVVLEGAWTTLALVGIVRKLRKPAASQCVPASRRRCFSFSCCAFWFSGSSRRRCAPRHRQRERHTGWAGSRPRRKKTACRTSTRFGKGWGSLDTARDAT